MKALISIWNQRIAPVFDVSSEFILLDINNKQITEEARYQLSDRSLTRKVELLRLTEAEIVICGALSHHAINIVESMGIGLFPFIAGEYTAVLKALQLNQLQSGHYAMPGCRARCRQFGQEITDRLPTKRREKRRRLCQMEITTVQSDHLRQPINKTHNQNRRDQGGDYTTDNTPCKKRDRRYNEKGVSDPAVTQEEDKTLKIMDNDV